MSSCCDPCEKHTFRIKCDKKCDTVEVMDGLQIPIVESIDNVSPSNEGSIVIDRSTCIFYFACGGEWLQPGSGLTGPSLILTDTTPSTNCDTGTLIVEGGTGIHGDLWVCGAGHFGFTGAPDFPLAPLLTVQAGGTAGTTTTLAGSQTVNQTLTLPNITDTLVSRNSTDILTNKTLIAPTDNVTASALFSGGRTNTVSVFSSPNPVAGQVLTATSPNTAVWSPAGTGITTLALTSTTPSTSCSTGALTVDGGVGIDGDLWVCGAGHFGFTGNVNPLSPVLQVQSGGSLSTTTILSGSQTANRTLMLPDITDTIVSRNSVDVLTNKTIISSTDNVTASSLFSGGRTNTVSIFGATNPVAGQVLTATTPTTAVWSAPVVPPATPLPFGYFYGLTTGTGNVGPNDYAGTIAVGAAVPFPRPGPAFGGVIGGPTVFILPNIGTYEVTFKAHTTEPGQLQLTLNGTPVPESTTPNMNPTAGGHPIVGNAVITTVAPGALLSVINPAGNSTALTITPANGAQTHANAQSISIKQIA